MTVLEEMRLAKARIDDLVDLDREMAHGPYVCPNPFVPFTLPAVVYVVSIWADTYLMHPYHFVTMQLAGKQFWPEEPIDLDGPPVEVEP